MIIVLLDYFRAILTNFKYNIKFQYIVQSIINLISGLFGIYTDL